MQKNGLIRFIVILSLLPLMAACAALSSVQNAGSAGSISKGASPGGSLYVLGGAPAQNAGSASLRIVSFQPDSTRAGVQLPNGLISLDHQRLYTAVPEAGHTRISVLKTQDAGILRSFVIPGTYATADTMFDHAVISFDGHWLALRALPVSASRTTIALIDTQAGRLSRTIELNGDFDLDALSPDGSRVYLLQRLHDGTSHYYVRLYQVDQGQLLTFPIVDKSEIDETQMNGAALVRQVAADGSKVFTLYIDEARNIAFIHILPLTGSYLGARCIDLAVGSDPALLHYYTLALYTGSDGTSTLYAANGALGVVTVVNVLPGDEVFNLNINAVAHFSPPKSNVTAAVRSRLLYNGAALSPDGQALFFAGLQGIWSVKTGDLLGQRPAFRQYLPDLAFTSLGLNSGGTTLYAIEPGQGILTLDARTGRAGSFLQAPVMAPWGIEWTE